MQFEDERVDRADGSRQLLLAGHGDGVVVVDVLGRVYEIAGRIRGRSGRHELDLAANSQREQALDMVCLQVGFRETESQELGDQGAFVAARSARKTRLAGGRKGI